MISVNVARNLDEINKMSTENNEKMYMNPPTGSVETLDGWFPYTKKDGLLEVVMDKEGEWQEVE